MGTTVTLKFEHYKQEFQCEQKPNKLSGVAAHDLSGFPPESVSGITGIRILRKFVPY